MVALLIGSATLLFSCKEEERVVEESPDTIKTEEGQNLTMIMSENGRKSYVFVTPLLEGYTMGRDPYREFCKGIEITTYQDDMLTAENTNLVANYAIYYEKRKLWEARGDVVVTKDNGNRRLYTQQLFWNSVTKRIYSNVDTKLVTYSYDDEGNLIEEEIIGEGFESDEEMNEPRFRRWKASMYVNPETLKEEQEEQDSVAPQKESSKVVTPKPQLSTVEKPTKAVEPQVQAVTTNTSTKSVAKSTSASGRPDNPFTKPASSGAGKGSELKKRNVASGTSSQKTK